MEEYMSTKKHLKTLFTYKTGKQITLFCKTNYSYILKIFFSGLRIKSALSVYNLLSFNIISNKLILTLKALYSYPHSMFFKRIFFITSSPSYLQSATLVLKL